MHAIMGDRDLVARDGQLDHLKKRHMLAGVHTPACEIIPDCQRRADANSLGLFWVQSMRHVGRPKFRDRLAQIVADNFDGRPESPWLSWSAFNLDRLVMSGLGVCLSNRVVGCGPLLPNFEDLPNGI